jgi:hypothetical protein
MEAPALGELGSSFLPAGMITRLPPVPRIDLSQRRQRLLRVLAIIATQRVNSGNIRVER